MAGGSITLWFANGDESKWDAETLTCSAHPTEAELIKIWIDPAGKRLLTGDKQQNITVWDAAELRFAVREPYPSRSTGAELVFGRITPGSPLEILSQMPEGGVIFSDGMENDSLDFTAGLTARIGIAPNRGRLIV